MPRAVRETGIPSAVRVRLLTASLEDDTEFLTRFGFLSCFRERSLTFSFASLKLLLYGLSSAIDLGFELPHSCFRCTP